MLGSLREELAWFRSNCRSRVIPATSPVLTYYRGINPLLQFNRGAIFDLISSIWDEFRLIVGEQLRSCLIGHFV